MCLNLDLEGICASTGSACSSSTLEASHVLLALGLPHEQAHGSLRFTLGKWTAEEEIDRVMEFLPIVVAKLRAMSPLLKSHG
jgi:cysteine desulfurase